MSTGTLHSIGDHYGRQTGNEHCFGNAVPIILQMAEHA